VSAWWRRGPADWRRLLGGHPIYPVLALTTMAVVDEVDQAAYGLFGPDVVRTFDISPATYGLATLPVVVLGLGIPLLVGRLADRLNRVAISIGGGALWCCFAILTGLVPTFLLLVVARALAAVGRGVSGPVHSSLISDYYPVDGRGAAFGLHQNAQPIGHIVGALGGGAIAAVLGWQAAFLILPLPGFVAVVMLTRLREPQRGAHDTVDDDTWSPDAEQPLPSLREALSLLANIVSWRRYAIVWLLLAIGVAMSSVFSFYFAAVFGVGAFGRGAILAATAALSVVGATVGGVLGQRLLKAGDTTRLGYLLVASIVAFALTLVLSAFAPDVQLAIAVILVSTPFRALAAVPVLLVLSATVPARIRGQAFGALSVFFACGLLFLPIALAYGDRYSYRVSLLIGALPVVVAAVIAATAAPAIAGDVDRATKVSAAERAVRLRRQAGERIDLLEVAGLDVHYGTVQILFGVDFRVADGEMVALLGTNGAGKSTLLRAVSGLIRPSRGLVLFDGTDITGRPAEVTAAAGVVQMPGGRGVFPGLTVERNLRLGAFLYRRDAAQARKSLDATLEIFPRLGERLHQPAGTLSGGEQQMVALAQAFMSRPRILMIDELSLGLAPLVVEELLGVVRRINDTGVTVILVEQSVNIALSLTHRAYFLEKGEVRFEGASAELLHRDDLVRSVFLAGAGAGQ
jgi:branched-chain amino acid transport system ATP-binding protein